MPATSRFALLFLFFVTSAAVIASPLGDKGKAESEYSNALMLYHAAQFKGAIDHLNACVSEDSHHPRAWNLLGLAYLSVADYPNAESAFKKAIEVNSHDPYAYNNLGRVYLREKNQEEAEKAFRKQIDVNGHDKYASYNLGLLLRDRGDYVGALKELGKAEFYSQPNARLHVDKGEIYLRESDPEKARAEFDKAVEISPTPTIWNNVAYALARHQTDLDKAKKLAESAVSATSARLRAADLTHPTRAEFALSSALASYWDTLGWVYYQRGEYDKAEPYLKSSWQVSHHGEIAEHIGDLQQRRGDRDASLKWYALGSVTELPSRSAGEKLSLLAPQQAESLKSAAKDELAAQSRLRLDAAPADGDYKLAVAYSSDAPPTITFMSNGANADLIPQLKKTNYPISFPDGSPTTLLLASEVKCEKSSCAMSMLPPETGTRDEGLTLGSTGDLETSSSNAPASIPPGLTPPQLTKQTNPSYPEDARQQRLQGPVRLELIVDSDGKPKELRAVDGNPIFYQAAVDCVKKWKFKPAMKDGNPVAVKINVEINFRLY